ncbi:MAG: SpoIID/LytB domain-containing protein [bacterium]
MTTKARYLLFAALLAGAAAVLVFQVKAGAPPPVLRVKLAELHAETVTIKGHAVKWRGSRKYRLEGRARIRFQKGRLYFNGHAQSLPLRVYGGDSVSIDGEAFRGDLLVTDSRPPLLINLVDAESYVAGVINQEIDSRWPEAAVDAQSILARSYALKRKKERAGKSYDLDRTVHDQVYGGLAAEDELSRASAKRTRGMVLSYKGETASGHYHSCCGGRTELPGEVWDGENAPYHKSVKCNHCREAPRYFWRFPEKGAVSGSKLASLLGTKKRVQDIKITETTGTGRAGTLAVRTRGRNHRFSGNEFRRRTGYERIRSTSFRVDREEEGFVFRGSGAGHGVGMCQWGAKGLAKKGRSARQILEFYFPGTGVTELY